MSFHVGQKVVCVDDGPEDTEPKASWHPTEEIHVGAIYTVKRAFLNDYGNPTLWLMEVARSGCTVAQWGPSVGYAQFRFRPVIERKTDTGFSILDDIRKRESVEDEAPIHAR